MIQDVEINIKLGKVTVNAVVPASLAKTAEGATKIILESLDKAQQIYKETNALESEEEEVIREAIIDARRVQNYLWGDLSQAKQSKFNHETWKEIFQKRVDKINQIKDLSTSGSIVELRKRVLQQAALSIQALKIIDKLQK